MPRRPHVPDALRQGHFTRDHARRHGLSDRQLQSACWRRLFPGVWAWAEWQPGHEAWVGAASAALPEDAQPTGATLLRLLGYDDGSAWFPLHCVIARDHHAHLDGVFLHRTDAMPATGALGVSPTAAFIAYCAEATVLEAARAGDWLVAQGSMSVHGLVETASAERWRAGSRKARWIARHLRADSRSPEATSWRLRFVAAGLPEPEVNVSIHDAADALVTISDLGFLRWHTVAEYEGGRHQQDPRQYLVDLQRYADLRRLGIDYVQLTRATSPVAGVVAVYRAMCRHGYEGPAPVFTGRWRDLGRRLSRVVRRSGTTSTESGLGNVDQLPPVAG
ncbi:hypothetical protein [Aeromicrobium piscarium]|uniref:DUF559 domain-containing protein n=1 Tax=Aeromicrobium piscarium TaxID=2590901 RepID=A0A554S7A2_9ACTN|nr:hypothetical protein [Aeromicrobium piscarium]TSD62238.1 hypothetical protein FNM00_12875 [Aeromicrobium piscarium]